jgi:hypothetical protein
MLPRPRCDARSCKHFRGISSTEEERDQRPVCAAFPLGIPDEIAYGDNDHTEPYLGDNGVRYEKDDDA